MKGGLIQLVIQGVQDTPLIVNPEITFFKAVYKTYTNFSIEHNKQNLGRAKFSQIISKNIDKLGDLLHNLTLQISVPYFSIQTITVTSELLVQGYSINSIGINWENHNCLVLYSENKWYIVPEKLFELTEFTKNIVAIRSEIIEPKLLPSFINYADLGPEMKYYNIAGNEISSFISIAIFNSNFWQKLWLDYTLNSNYETQMITLKSYNTKLNEIFRKEIFNNYWFNYPQASYPELYNFTFNNGIKEMNEVERYYDLVSGNNQTNTLYKYDIDIIKDYTNKKGLDFNNWASIQYNAGMIQVIYELIYANSTLIYTFWKKYSVKFGNIPVSNVNSNGIEGEWEYQLNNYMNSVFRSVTINNQIFDEFKSKYYAVYKTIDSGFKNLILTTPLDIYIKLKTIMNRFYLVPSTQINFNDRFYSSFYPNSVSPTGVSLTNLVLADSFAYQIQQTKSSYPNLFANVNSLDLTNEMNNLTPVDLAHIYPIICQEFVNFIESTIYSNSDIMNWIVFWKNNVVIRLYLSFLDYYGLSSINQDLKDNGKTRNLTYYYGLFPSNSFNTNDFRNSFYSNYYKSNFIGYYPTTSTQFNVLKSNINVVKSQDLFKSTFTDNNTKFSNLKISQTKVITPSLGDEVAKYIIDGTKLYIKYNNWVDTNTTLYLTIDNKIVSYDKFYLEYITNQEIDINNGLYLAFENVNIENINIGNITIDSVRNIQIPVVMFDPTDKNVPYPSIQRTEYNLLTKNYNGSIETDNIIDENTFNLTITPPLPTSTIMYNILYGTIIPPKNTFEYEISSGNNINYVDPGTHLYCISWITSTSESNVSNYIRVDLPSYKIDNIEKNYKAVLIKNLPVPIDSNIIGIRFYRTKADDTKFYLLDTIYNTTNLYNFLDNIPDSKLTNELGSYDIQTKPNNSYCESKRVTLDGNKLKYDDGYITFPVNNYSNILRIYLTIIDTGLEIVSNSRSLTENYYEFSDYDHKYNYWMATSDLLYVQKLVPNKEYIPFKNTPFGVSSGPDGYSYKISYYNTENNTESIVSSAISGVINSVLSNFSPIYASDYNAYKIYRADSSGVYYHVATIKSDVNNFTSPSSVGEPLEPVKLYIDEPVKNPILSNNFTLIRTPIVNYAPNLYPWTSAPTDPQYMCSKKNSDISDQLFTKPFIMIGANNTNPEYRTFNEIKDSYTLDIIEEIINNIIKQTITYIKESEQLDQPPITYYSVLYYEATPTPVILPDIPFAVVGLPSLPLTSIPSYYYTNESTLKLCQNLNTLYFYNIDQIVDYNSTIELDGHDITNIMPVAFNQFFSRNYDMVSSTTTTQYIDDYYLLDLSGSGNAIKVDDVADPYKITQKTWTPHFDSLGLPSNWLSNNIYWYNFADIQINKLNLVISSNDDYIAITNLIDTITNQFDKLLDYFITQYNSIPFYGLSTKQVITNSKTISNVPDITTYSNNPFKNYSQGMLRLYQVDALSTNIVLNTFGQKVKTSTASLVNVLSPVYTYYNAHNKLGNTLPDYLSNVDNFFTTHINYVNSNTDWLNISAPSSYQEKYDSYENIVGKIQDNYYTYSGDNTVTLAFKPSDDFDTININGQIITDFTNDNNNIIITNKYSVNQIENKPYNTIVNQTNIYEFIPDRFNYLGLVKLLDGDFDFNDTLGTTYTTLTLDDMDTINISYNNGYNTNDDCINIEVLNPIFDTYSSFPIVIQSNKIYPYYNKNNLIQQIQSIKDDDYILLENDVRVIMKKSELKTSSIPNKNYKLWCLTHSLDLLKKNTTDYWASGTISINTTLNITLSAGYLDNSFYLVSNSSTIDNITNSFIVFLSNGNTIDTGLLPSINYFSGINSGTVYLYLINPELFGKEYRQRITSDYNTTKKIGESGIISEVEIFQPLWNMPYMEPNDEPTKIDLIKSIANYIVVPETNEIYLRSEFNNIDKFIYWTSNYATIKYCNGIVKNDFDWTLTSNNILYIGEIIIINKTSYFIVDSINGNDYKLKLIRGDSNITSPINHYYTLGTIKNSINRIFEPSGNIIFKYMAPLSYKTFYLNNNKLSYGIPSSSTFVLFSNIKTGTVRLYSDGTYLYLQDDWVNIKPLDIIEYSGELYKILAINQGRIVLDKTIAIGWINIYLPYQPFELKWITIENNGKISNNVIENNNTIGIDTNSYEQNLYWVKNGILTSFNGSVIPSDGKYLVKIYKTNYKGLFENAMVIPGQNIDSVSSDYPITLPYSNGVVELSFLTNFDFYLSQPVLINGVFGRLTKINGNQITIYYENTVPIDFNPTSITFCPSIITKSDYWTRTKFYYDNQIYPNLMNNNINVVRFCLNSETLLFIQKYKDNNDNNSIPINFNLSQNISANEDINNIKSIPNTTNIYFYENMWLQEGYKKTYTLEIGSYHLVYSDLSNTKYDTINLVKIISQNKFINCTLTPIKAGLISFGKLIDAWHNGNGDYSWGAQKILTGNRLQNIINDTVKLSKSYNINFKGVPVLLENLYKQEIRFEGTSVDTNIFSQVYLDSNLTIPVKIEYGNSSYYLYFDTFKSNISIIYTLQENWIVSSTNSNRTLSSSLDTMLEKYINPITTTTKQGYIISSIDLLQTANSNKDQIYGYRPDTLLDYSKSSQYLEDHVPYSIDVDYNNVKQLDIQTRVLKTTWTLSIPDTQNVAIYALTNTGTFSNIVGISAGLNNLKLYSDYTITNPIPNYDYLFNSGSPLKLINKTSINENYIYNKVKKWDWYSLLNGLNNNLTTLVNNYYGLKYDNGVVLNITTVIPSVNSYGYMIKDETTMLTEFLISINDNATAKANYIYTNNILEPKIFNQIPNWLSNCEFFFDPTKYINDWLKAVDTDILFNGTNLIFSNDPNPELNSFGEIASYITNEYIYDDNNNRVYRNKTSDFVSEQINKWLSDPSATGNYGVSVHKVLRYLNELGELFKKTYNEWGNNITESNYMTPLKFILDKISASIDINVKPVWNITQFQEITSNPFRNMNTAYSSTNYIESIEIEDVNIENNPTNIESNVTNLVEYTTAIHIKDSVTTTLSQSAKIPYSIEFDENVIYNGCSYSIEMSDKTKIDDIDDIQLYTSKMTFYSDNNLDGFPIVYQKIMYTIKNIEYKGIYHKLIFNGINIDNIDNLWWNGSNIQINKMQNVLTNAHIFVYINGTPSTNDLFQIKNNVGIKSIIIDNDKQYITFYSNNFKYIDDNTYIQFTDNNYMLMDDNGKYYIDSINIISDYNPVIITCISLSGITSDDSHMYKIEINEQFGVFQSIPYQPSANYDITKAILPGDYEIANNNTSKKATEIQSIDSSTIYFYTDQLINSSYTKLNYTNRLSHVNISYINTIEPQEEYLYKVNKIIPKCDDTKILLLSSDDPVNNIITTSIYFNQESGSTFFTFDDTPLIDTYKWAQKNQWDITNNYNYSSGILSFTAPPDFIFDSSYKYYINNTEISSNKIIFQSNVLYITTSNPTDLAVYFNQYYVSSSIGEIITPQSNQSMKINLLYPTQFSSNLKFYTTYFNNLAETFDKYLYVFSDNISYSYPTTGQFKGDYNASDNDIILIKNGVEWTGKIIDKIDTDYYLVSLDEEIDIDSTNWYMYKDNIKTQIYNLSYYSNSYNFGDYYKQDDLNNIYIFGEPTNNKYIYSNFTEPLNHLYLASYFDYKMTNLYEPDIAVQLEDMKQIVSASTTKQIQTLIPEFKEVYKMFKNMKIYFGDQLIEQLNPDTYALDYWLYMDANRKKQAEKLVKIYDDGENYKWYIPLRFWFCMGSGLALPTLAMTNTNIRVEFELEDINNFIKNMPTKPNSSNIVEWKYEYTKIPTARLDLISDFILLDNAERRLFGTHSHEYIIERYRIYHNYFITNSNELIPTYRNFNGLVKDLHMISKPINYPDLTYIPSITPMYDTRYARYITALKYYNIFILTNSYTSKEQYTYSQDINIIGQTKSRISSLNSGEEDNLLQSIYDFFSTWEIWTDDLFQYLGYFAVYYYSNFLVKGEEKYEKINYLMSMYLKYTYSPKVHIEEISPVLKMKIQIDGTDLFSSQSSNYWNGVIPTTRFENYVPQGYYSWTWSLNPLELQPSGSLNFSNFENVIIQVESDKYITPTNPYILNTIIKEYNIMRIMGGIGALGFVN